MRTVWISGVVGLALLGAAALGSAAHARPDAGVVGDAMVDGMVTGIGDAMVDAMPDAILGVAEDGTGDAIQSPTPALDEGITRRLDAAFSVIDRLADVRVSVHAGVVVLDGVVPSARAREAAEAIAGRVDGVLYVHNRLALRGIDRDDSAGRTEADEAIAAQLEAIYDNAPDLRDVEVEVARGVVRLGGAAPSDAAMASAEKVAAGLTGVVYVSNGIALEVADVGDRVGPLMRKLREQGRQAVEFLPILGIALAVFAVFYAFARVLRGWDQPFRLVSDNVLARSIARQVVFAAVLLVGLLLALEIAGATAVVGAVLGTAGVLGLALGFALQDIVQNYISGVMLSLRQPFEPHDLVQIGDHQGAIVKLTSRETLLMTLDGNHLRIPNATVFGATLVNFTRNPERRFEFTVGVGTDEDLVEAQRLGLSTLAATEGVLADPRPMAQVESLADSTVVLRFFGWVDQKRSDFAKTRSVAIRKVKVAFDGAGVEMPVPMFRVDTAPVGEASIEAARKKRAQLLAQSPSPAAPAVDDVSVDPVLDEKVSEARAEPGDDLLGKGR